jgi:hypothetical protein
MVLTLKDKAPPLPISVFYEFYDDINELQTRLESESEQINVS